MSLFEVNNSRHKISVSDNKRLLEYFQNVNMKYLSSDAYPICGLTYLNSDCFIIDDYIFVINSRQELMAIPFNKNGDTIKPSLLLTIMREHKIKKIVCVPETHYWLSRREPLSKKFKITEAKGFGLEYIYDNFLLAELQGKDFKNLRNKVHKFRNRYGDDIVIKEYTSDMFDVAMSCYKLWYDSRGKEIILSGKKVWDESFFSSYV